MFFISCVWPASTLPPLPVLLCLQNICSRSIWGLVSLPDIEHPPTPQIFRSPSISSLVHLMSATIADFDSSLNSFLSCWCFYVIYWDLTDIWNIILSSTCLGFFKLCLLVPPLVFVWISYILVIFCYGPFIFFWDADFPVGFSCFLSHSPGDIRRYVCCLYLNILHSKL